MSNLSSFDPEVFASTQIKDKLADEYINVPVGEYPATIQAAKASKGTSKTSGEDYARFEITWDVQDEQVRAALGGRAMVRQSFLLDINEQGALANGPNQNVRLGQLLTAIGLNNGKGWSPAGLVGSHAWIKVDTQRNPPDPSNPGTEVVRVARDKNALATGSARKAA